MVFWSLGFLANTAAVILFLSSEIRIAKHIIYVEFVTIAVVTLLCMIWFSTAHIFNLDWLRLRGIHKGIKRATDADLFRDICAVCGEEVAPAGASDVEEGENRIVEVNPITMKKSLMHKKCYDSVREQPADT